MKFTDLIWTTDNALSASFCKKTIKKFEERVEDQKHGIVGGGYVPSIKRSTDLHISGNDAWTIEDKVFYESLNKHYDIYRKHVNHSGLYEEMGRNCNDVGYQLQKTVPGEYYHWHHDSIPEWNIQTETLSNRIVTFIWYLNDVTDDNGGYTEFIDGTRIQPKQGKMLFFPSTWNYVHRGVSPVDEIKYICTGWMYTDFTIFSQNLQVTGG